MLRSWAGIALDSLHLKRDPLGASRPSTSTSSFPQRSENINGSGEGTTGFCRILPDVDGFCGKVTDLAGFGDSRILTDLAGFCRILMDFAGF